ncbi:helix-turn-helix domain-containing protein [Streptomyces sp. NPDC002740]
MENDARPDSVEGLGQFLRSRRERLGPAAAGLSGAGRRRVSGLRRDEIAALAGVGLSYYSRLEQGARVHPGNQRYGLARRSPSRFARCGVFRTDFLGAA